MHPATTTSVSHRFSVFSASLVRGENKIPSLLQFNRAHHLSPLSTTTALSSVSHRTIFSASPSNHRSSTQPPYPPSERNCVYKQLILDDDVGNKWRSRWVQLNTKGMGGVDAKGMAGVDVAAEESVTVRRRINGGGRGGSSIWRLPWI
ncbi:hypothetical protein R6Q59_012237 [Mikania micrantha]